MIEKEIRIVIVLMILIISFICGCMENDENKEESYYFDWAYHVCISNNYNNVSFFLYLPIPLLLNGTNIDVSSQKNFTREGGNLSIEKTNYGYAYNVSSKGNFNIATGERKRDHDIDIIDHMVLTMMTTVNYSDLKRYENEPIGFTHVWIYSNASNNTNLQLYMYFGYSWGKMIGEKRIEERRNIFEFPFYIEIKNGWQLVECQPWGGNISMSSKRKYRSY